METRVGFVGIIVENRNDSADRVNKILSDCGNVIVARTGVPYDKKNCCVITLVVDASTDDLGLLTGKLGSVPGVTVKSALSKSK
ncbi:iron-only hydrogenase system regulator [Chitinispirillales bacterium ANBcel5]|uniref:TM1266 family iron-only hydrogenase system putative regulator n=1 Tax=Cellulosispirillum alkaliphilum TaxID=3039283 RepID=UPI002A514F2E|nr:iron-only hydrogenase system regulator [Chitinispirillales bacterium ANBcel5]